LKKEKQIIWDSIMEAVGQSEEEPTRHNISRKAAIIADEHGVNVIKYPYLQNIFYEYLDENGLR